MIVSGGRKLSIPAPLAAAQITPVGTRVFVASFLASKIGMAGIESKLLGLTKKALSGLALLFVPL
jgi:hypothetical protein